ncbi:MAG: hypothetical protein WAL63_05200 [Solirubrobacteraceae bacterium]
MSRAEFVLLAALAAWALFPLVLALIHAAEAHARFTGADGLIGADGVLGADQLQYLAWARDAGAHGGFASDLFSLSPSGHVYLEPLFAITGALFSLGVSLPVAYLVWKPIAIVILALAAVAWARRLFADQLAARAATVALSLFLCTPIAALFSWAQLGGSSRFGFNLYLLSDELLAANKLWGYVPSAIGLALVPVSLLAAERAVDPDVRPAAGRRKLGHGVVRSPLIVASLAAGFASWLHPWQGITLVLIFAGLAVLQRRRHPLALAAPAIAAALPLIYYYWLAHSDPAWQLAGQYEVISRFAPLVLLAGFGPLALIAILGLAPPGDDVIEQALLLWIAGCFVTYVVNSSFAPHALQGLSLPLAALIVRGGQRLRVAPALGLVVIGLLTVPGLAFDARKFVRTARSDVVQYYLPHSDADALDWVAHRAPAGGVLAPTPFAAVIPSQTGRAVWVGHGYWSRDYPARARAVDRLFGGRMSAAASRRFVAGTGASLLVSDCRHPADLTRTLGSSVRSVRRFGCARVYVLRAP